jgi:hypothetical protein
MNRQPSMTSLMGSTIVDFSERERMKNKNASTS